MQSFKGIKYGSGNRQERHMRTLIKWSEPSVAMAEAQVGSRVRVTGQGCWKECSKAV